VTDLDRQVRPQPADGLDGLAAARGRRQVERLPAAVWTSYQSGPSSAWRNVTRAMSATATSKLGPNDQCGLDTVSRPPATTTR
jgi:hypothetical protein